MDQAIKIKQNDDAFLAECEAKSNEAKAIAEKATQGPWIANDYYQCVATHSSEVRLMAVCRFGNTPRPADDAEFIAHARTSNPNLADRVLALTKMVRERDELIAPLLEEKRVVLRQCMSDISEECWCASWLSGCEFSLWQFVLDGPGDWGQDSVTQEEIDELKRLSALVGGWFCWNDDAPHFGEQFVPMAEWLVMYNAWAVR